MPANYPIETIYLQTGDYPTENNQTLFKPGELGARTITGFQREWQRVQLDSGATASTSVGVVAAGQVAYWKSTTSYIVTNDVAQALGGQAANSGFRNFVAGIFQNKTAAGTVVTLTPGNFITIQTKGPSLNNVKCTSTPGVGDYLVSDTSTSAAQTAAVTAGTAPTCQIVGTVTGAKSGSAVPADLNVAPLAI